MAPSLNLADLGRRVRTARLARRLTLEDVVSRTDFTVSWLSKIENGLLAPSLEGLVRLSEVLECGVEQLVAGLAVAPRFVVDRRGEAATKTRRNGRSGVVFEPLADRWQQRAMEPAILHISNAGNRKNPDHHDGERFLHVLAGDVKVRYGDELIVLAEGDSVYLDASLPHAIFPGSRGTSRVLSVSFEPARNGRGAAKGRPSPAQSSDKARSGAASRRKN
jgi:transcriptional regulator with XRE-family HTH domain